MSIRQDYLVRHIPISQTYPWLKLKHYMYRVPAISHSFGLYRTADMLLQGVCTYGPPSRMFNKGYGLFEGKIERPTYELNRLVVNEGLPRGTLSFFVAQTFKGFEKPAVLVSYADGNSGHHGYIYQATNWLYLGVTKPERIYFDTRQQKVVHQRTISDMFGTASKDKLPEWIEITMEEEGKYRYLQLLGSKVEVSEMRQALVYDVLPYPKGDNRRYDADVAVPVQTVLF